MMKLFAGLPVPRHTLSTSADGLMLCDSEGTILLLNKAAKILKATKSSELLGKKVSIDASNMLIQGESGTGKGLRAKCIYQNSSRGKKHLCSSIQFAKVGQQSQEGTDKK